MEYGFVWLYKNSTLSAPTLPFPTKVELNPYSRFLQHQKLSSPFSPLLNHNPPSMRIQPIRKRINPPSPPLLSPPPPLHRHSGPYILRPSDSQNQTPQDKDRQPSNLTIVAASGTNGVDYSSDEMNNSTTNQVQLSSISSLSLDNIVSSVWFPRNLVSQKTPRFSVTNQTTLVYSCTLLFGHRCAR